MVTRFDDNHYLIGVTIILHTVFKFLELIARLYRHKKGRKETQIPGVSNLVVNNRMLPVKM